MSIYIYIEREREREREREKEKEQAHSDLGVDWGNIIKIIGENEQKECENKKKKCI